MSGLIPKSHSRTLFGAEGTRRLGNHRIVQKKLFIQNGVSRARHDLSIGLFLEARTLEGCIDRQHRRCAVMGDAQPSVS